MGSHVWVCDRTVKMMHRLRGRSARCWSCSNIFCLTDPTGLSHAASQVHLVWHASHLILLKTQPQVQTQTGFWLFEATYHFLRRQCRAVRKSTTCQSAPVFSMVLRIFVRFVWSSESNHCHISSTHYYSFAIHFWMPVPQSPVLETIAS